MAKTIWVKTVADFYYQGAQALWQEKTSPLSAINVVVPDEEAALSFNRALTKDQKKAAFGVNCVTTLQLAIQVIDRGIERAGIPVLEPVPIPVLVQTWRYWLQKDPGVLGAIADLPGTVQTLAQMHPALVRLGNLGRLRLAEVSPIQSDIVRVFDQVEDNLDGWTDPSQILNQAAELLSRGGADLSDFGPVISMQSRRLTAAEDNFFEALSAKVPLTVVGFDLAASDAPKPQRFVMTSDSDDECRWVTRQVKQLLAEGTQAREIAVLYPANSPYGIICADLFASADIQFYGSAPTSLARTGAAYAVLAPLEFDPRSLSRTQVFAWLRALPLRIVESESETSGVPVSKWEKIAFEAGVAHGNWVEPLRIWIENHPDSPKEKVARDLTQFIERLERDLLRGVSETTSSRLISWYTKFLDTYYHGRYPREEDRQVLKTVRAALSQITETEDQSLTRAHLEELLCNVLESIPAPRHQGTTNSGIFLGEHSLAASVNAPHTFVMGLSEDLTPGVMRPNPLLPEETLRDIPGFLSLDKRVEDIERSIQQAFTAENCVATFSRGDLRGTAGRVPSRFLIEPLRAASGSDDVTALKLEKAGNVIEVVPSSWTAMLQAPLPLNDAEYQLRQVLAGRAPNAAAFTWATQMLEGRVASPNPYDGDLSSLANTGLLPNWRGERTLSASALEQYIEDPLAFFIERILGVRELEDLELESTIGALARGSLIHEVFEELVRSRKELPGFGEPFSDEDRAAAGELFDAAAEKLFQSGQAGIDVFWQIERDVVKKLFFEMLHRDDQVRQEYGTKIVSAELAFGEEESFEVTLPEGKPVRFRGKIDRVEETPSGVVHVVDFKTGKSDSYKDIKDEPGLRMGDGNRLQLPLYALAAGFDGSAPMVARYLFRDGKTIAVSVNEELIAQFKERVSQLVADMENGRFYLEEV